LRRASISAEPTRESSKIQPAIRLYYRQPEVSASKSNRRTREFTQVNSAPTGAELSREPIDSRPGHEQKSARRHTSDQYLESDGYLESETYIYRRQPSTREYLNELGSSMGQPKRRNSSGLSSRSASDMPSPRRDSIIAGERTARHRVSSSPIRYDTVDGQYATPKAGDALGRSSHMPSSPLIHAAQTKYRSNVSPTMQDFKPSRSQRGILGPYAEDTRQRTESMKVHDGNIVSEHNREARRRTNGSPALQDAKVSRPKRGMLGPYAEDLGQRSESMKVHDGSMVSEDNRRTSQHDRHRRERR
jgi:hypothetical protein